MKKLTKKQAQIIAYMKESIAIDVETLRQYHAEKNTNMVSHCQHSISDQLSGVASYIIYSTNNVWDERLSDAYHKIRNMPELKLDYWQDCLNRETK